MTKMMVHNLSSRTTVESLNRLFSEFGAVRSVSLATDIMTGRCGGFGFVNLDEQETGAALHALDGRSVGGRVLRVTFEQKREPGGAPIQRVSKHLRRLSVRAGSQLADGALTASVETGNGRHRKT